MRFFVALLALSFLAFAQDPKPTDPPKIDYKLQFEARTLDLAVQTVATQLEALRARFQAKLAEIQAACGLRFTASIGQTSEFREYECVAKPLEKRP